MRYGYQGVFHIKVAIITPDEFFFNEMRKLIEELGHSAVEENNINDFVDVVLLDHRNKNDRGPAGSDAKYLKSSMISIAMVNGALEPPIEKYSEYADIIFYPTKKEELLARIKLAAFQLKRDFNDDVYEFESFKINFSNYEVVVDGKLLDLTYKEYELLRHLATAPGRVFTRSQLLKSVWGYDYIEGARTVDVHVRRLRSKLGNKYANQIETVRHVGYRFKRPTY
jgi:DNA-binding response OmpR family regulator